jgi:hypothetical protein
LIIPGLQDSNTFLARSPHFARFPFENTIEGEILEHWWNDTDRGKLEVLHGKFVLIPFVNESKSALKAFPYPLLPNN